MEIFHASFFGFSGTFFNRMRQREQKRNNSVPTVERIDTKMKMKNRIAALLLCLSMGTVLVAFGEDNTVDTAPSTQSNPPAAVADSTSSAQQSTSEITTDSETGEQQSVSELELADMVNPWVDVETQQDAQEQADFAIQLPTSLPDEYGAPGFRVIPGDILEADYAGTGDGKIVIRKAVGTEDPSGDYSQYSHSQQVKTGGVTVTMKGNDGAVCLAVWQDGEYAYSIDIYEASGISAEEMTRMVSEMMKA